MNLPVFAISFLVFIGITNYQVRKITKKENAYKGNYWAEEQAANRVPRKSLDDLHYLQVPLDRLPLDVMSDDGQVGECTDLILALSDEPIANLTGYTNTDLKFRYGAPNLTRLIRCDQNYTNLVTALQRWARRLYDHAYFREAATILEYAVETGTDVTASYELLCDLYQHHLDLSPEEALDRIRALIPTAEGLRSLSRDVILRKLREQLPETVTSD